MKKIPENRRKFEFFWILAIFISATGLLGLSLFLYAQYFGGPFERWPIRDFVYLDSGSKKNDRYSDSTPNKPAYLDRVPNNEDDLNLEKRREPAKGRILRDKVALEKGKPVKYNKKPMNLPIFDNLSAKYQPIANKIIDHLVTGRGKGQAYDRLAYIADTFGHRMVGSKALEDTIDYLLSTLNKEKLDNVHKEVVKNLPNWVRGEERATLLLPNQRNVSMKILGLGSTVPTPDQGLCAEAVVVTSFEELDRLGAAGVKGKIVVYNQPWINYGQSSQYRGDGASKASKYGAVAALVRSAASHSVYSPHTGQQYYDPQVTPIPVACLTVEDAEMLHRRQQRRETLKICLLIKSHPQGTVDSYNTVAEIKGSSLPDEIVMIGGHLDSWDVGTGAMDDGGGVVIAWQALTVIRALGLKPKRTIRAVFWTAEEQGYLGCTYYYNEHKKNMPNETYRFVYESDAGAFKPNGLCFNGTPEAWQIMQQVVNLLRPINADKLCPVSSVGDVDLWRQDGVPAAFLDSRLDDYYFTFHHSAGDNVVVFKPSDLDYASALTAVVAFVVADMDKPLPGRYDNVDLNGFD